MAEETNISLVGDNRAYSNRRNGENKCGGVERARIEDGGS